MPGNLRLPLVLLGVVLRWVGQRLYRVGGARREILGGLSSEPGYLVSMPYSLFPLKL